MRVGIIDYGVGNLGSVVQAVTSLHVKPVLIENPVDIDAADCLILPGVGSFADCKNILDQGGWTTALREVVLGESRPLLGICLGMQLLADASFEGALNAQGVSGLSLIPGQVMHLSSFGCDLPIPHVGWNDVVVADNNNQLFNGIPDGTDFYFVHSYAFAPSDSSNVLATTDYGVPITAAVRRGHIWGTQFHPEKSSRAGLRLLKNFIECATC